MGSGRPGTVPRRRRGVRERGANDGVADAAALEHIGALLPAEWLEPAAYGSAADCAQRVLRQFDLGVDGVIMHGATPKELAQVVHAYRDLRPAGRFDRLAANPGIAAQPAS